MNYTSREVVRRLKQYDMFLNTLNLSKDEIQRERICDQLDKIEKQILLETNTEYENEYLNLFSAKTSFFAEEKEKLNKLISLVKERRDYLDIRKEEHRKVTGSLVELTSFAGEDKIDIFKHKLDVIKKYEQNKKKRDKLIKELKVVDIKLSESSRIVKANTRLNDILEKKMITLVKDALNKYKLLSLTSSEKEITSNFKNLEYAFNIANSNLETARELKLDSYIIECREISDKINKDYDLYNSELNIIKLIKLFDNKVLSYEELLEKREKIDNILNNLVNTDIYKDIAEELNKQYNTIKLEKHDIENYEGLKLLREEKNQALYDIDKENNSNEFKELIGDLIKNEIAYREETIKKARKEEFEKRQKKLLEEQKIEASRLRRQKLIENSRLKEQQERIAKVKEMNDNTVLTKEEKKLPKNNPLENKTFEEIINESNNFNTDELFENTKIVPNKKQDLNTDTIFNDVETDSMDDFKQSKIKLMNELDLKDKEKVTIKEEINSLPFEEEINISKDTQEIIPIDKNNVTEEDKIYEDLKFEFTEEPPKEEKLNDIFMNDNNKDFDLDILSKDNKPLDIIDNSSKVEEDIKFDFDSKAKDIINTYKSDTKKIEPTKEENENKEASIYDMLENNDNIIWKSTDTKINKETIPIIENNNLNPTLKEEKKLDNLTFPMFSKEGGDK